MSHWALKYIGKSWGDETDCLYWFRTISMEQFGVNVPICGHIDHSTKFSMVKSAMKEMSTDILSNYGYKQTQSPDEGDAVFLTQRNNPHHIGMVLFLNGGEMHVLHALDGIGQVVISNRGDLALNGWKIESYWKHAT